MQPTEQATCATEHSIDNHLVQKQWANWPKQLLQLQSIWTAKYYMDAANWGEFCATNHLNLWTPTTKSANALHTTLRTSNTTYRITKNHEQISNLCKNWTEHEVNSQIAPKIAQTGTTRWPCPATPVPWTTPPTIPPRGEPPASRRQPEHSAATPRSVERMARRKTKTEWGENSLWRGISGHLVDPDHRWARAARWENGTQRDQNRR